MVEERYERNIGVWSEEFQDIIKDTTVGIAGLGGAGGTLPILLARNGFGKLKIADPDTYARHNIQRQYGATEETIGMNKAEVTEEIIKQINPDIEVIVYNKGIDENNIEDFIDGCDLVHEVIDYAAPQAKLTLHKKAREKKTITTTTALIASGVGTLVFHPDKMSFEEYFGISQDQGKIEDWKQDHNKIVKIDPDYIDRKFFLERVEMGKVPTCADSAYLAAVVTAGIYKRILMGKDVSYAPKMIRFDLLDDSMYEQIIMD